MSQPTRVAVTVGSDRITLYLTRDLVPAENPIDAYRDIRALLERMLAEFQQPGSKPGRPGPAAPAKTQQTGTVPPGLPAQKPAGLQLETVRMRLQKWLPDLEILDGFDGFSVKPKRYLGDTWSEVNEVMRSLSGKWQKGQTSKDGSWRMPK